MLGNSQCMGMIRIGEKHLLIDQITWSQGYSPSSIWLLPPLSVVQIYFQSYPPLISKSRYNIISGFSEIVNFPFSPSIILVQNESSAFLIQCPHYLKASQVICNADQ